MEGCNINTHLSINVCQKIFYIISFFKEIDGKKNDSVTGARVRKDVAPFHYPLCTDSIQPSLQFPWNFAVFYASNGSHFSRCVMQIKICKGDCQLRALNGVMEYKVLLCKSYRYLFKQASFWGLQYC
jgi:hypothetical protein